VIFAVVLVVVCGGAGVGLIAWWGSDMLAARRRPTAVPVPPTLTVDVREAGPGLSPHTVVAPAERIGDD